jgi:hypothetical protein
VGTQFDNEHSTVQLGEGLSDEGHGMKEAAPKEDGHKSGLVQYKNPQNKSVQTAKSLPRYISTMISHTVELCNFA